MKDLADGASTQVAGSGSAIYTLKNTGGVYSCTCPAWRNQSVPIERRTCKHLRRLRGEAAEAERTATALAPVALEKPAANAPALLLAHSWDNHQDLTGWWLSEKLDGVRAYWDGKGFVSRLGNPFHAPAWFTDGFPTTPLDGELWGGRKTFQRTVGIVKRHDETELWRAVTYVVFDAPMHPGDFEERQAHLRSLRASQHLVIHAQAKCEGLDHLRNELTRIEAVGGEGLMMRAPASRYESGRSTTLLKVKTFHDAEATVVAHAAGSGRHRGRLGALVVELADGKRFNVGTGFSDREREHPPGIGARITFRYQELSEAGIPRFPSFIRVRDDEPAAVPLQLPASNGPRNSKEKKTMAKTSKRHFEFVEGTSNKFWEITLDGSAYEVRYGKIGTDGAVQKKSFASPDEAKIQYDKIVAEKMKKGYVEKNGT